MDIRFKLLDEDVGARYLEINIDDEDNHVRISIETNTGNEVFGVVNIDKKTFLKVILSLKDLL